MEAKPTKPNYWVRVSQLIPKLRLLPKIFELLKPCLITFIISYVFKLIISVLNIQKANTVGKLVDIFTLHRLHFDLTLQIGLLVAFFIAIKLVAKVHRRINARIIETLNKEVKADLYKNILQKDLEFFDKKKPYHAVEAVNKGIESVQNLAIHRLHGTLNPLIKIVTTFALLSSISKELTLIVLFIAPLKVYLQDMEHKRLSKKKKLMAKDIVENPQEVPEIPSYSKQRIFLIKAFSTEEREIDSFYNKANDSVIQPKPVKKDFWNLKFVRSLTGLGFQAVVFAYGGSLILREKLSVGDLVTFNMHFLTFVASISSVLINFKMLLKSLAGTEKLFQVLDYEPKIKVGDTNGLKKASLQGDISFQNVSFRYPTKPDVEIFSNVSFEIKGGESVAFVGPTGSGKSTLIYLLLRLYDPTNGKVSIDGDDVKGLDITWLHRQIGFVPQDALLIDGTIEDNLLYGSDAGNRDDMGQVLAHANAEFVLDRKRFPYGLQTALKFDDSKLSLDEKIRIAIARALMKRPKVVVVEEPDYELNDKEAGELQKAMDNLIHIKDKTVIMASRRVNNARKCNRIFRFGEGRVLEEGRKEVDLM